MLAALAGAAYVYQRSRSGLKFRKRSESQAAEKHMDELELSQLEEAFQSTGSTQVSFNPLMTMQNSGGGDVAAGKMKPAGQTTTGLARLNFGLKDEPETAEDKVNKFIMKQQRSSFRKVEQDEK